MYYKIVNKTKNLVVAKKAIVANNFFKRLKGYMFQKNISDDDALIFYNTPSIHMFFMYFPLDIVFLDDKYKVIKIYTNLKPWRLANCFGSKITIELPAGKTIKIPIEEYDILNFIPYAN
ncbi:MAG: DUF192 domain-containing protein [Candidatus Omnitrophica bacterium]|nr:DUF192 domain-containing protein [Candidatus Omnitrophota bacterium]